MIIEFEELEKKIIDQKYIEILDNEMKEQPIADLFEPIQRLGFQNGFHIWALGSSSALQKIKILRIWNNNTVLITMNYNKYHNAPRTLWMCPQLLNN